MRSLSPHASGRRVWLAPLYVLHTRPYRDTSRIVEVFTREQGRLTLFARGANGPRSALKSVVRPFQRLLVSWSGKGEACRLVSAEMDGRATLLPTGRLMSGFYLNELVVKLTERCDPHPEIFEAYARCLESLSAGAAEERALRLFEKRLLDHLGFGLELSRTADGGPVDHDGYYRFQAQRGPQACVAEAAGAVYGRSLADLEAETLAHPRSLQDAKRMLRAALDVCLEGRELKSRECVRALRRRAAIGEPPPGRTSSPQRAPPPERT